MAEPLLPHHSSDVETTPAAEPGPGALEPDAPEEPDVVEEAGEDADPEIAEREADFVTPSPGERLHPEDLEN